MTFVNQPANVSRHSKPDAQLQQESSSDHFEKKPGRDAETPWSKNSRIRPEVKDQENVETEEDDELEQEDVEEENDDDQRNLDEADENDEK